MVIKHSLYLLCKILFKKSWRVVVRTEGGLISPVVETGMLIYCFDDRAYNVGRTCFTGDSFFFLF